jgi:branched-chain amino acid transport system substrate-binding protein
MAIRKRRIALALGGACVLLVTVACSSGGGSSSSTSSDGSTTAATGGGSSASAKSILICNVTDISGVQQPYGSTDGDGGVVAADMINAAGGIKALGGAKLVVQKFDTQSNTDMGTVEATKAVSAGCKAIWGGEITDTVLPGTDVTHRAGIPWVDIGGIGDEVHERGFNDVFQVEDTTGIAESYYSMMKQVVSTLHITDPTVGLSVSDTSYGQEFYAAWTKLNANGPFKVVSNVSYPLTTTDFSSIADRMVSQNPEILFNMGYPADGIALGRLLKQTFHTTAKAFFSTSASTTAMPQLGSLADGQLFEISSPPVSSANLTKFNQAYQAAIGSAPSIEAWNGYTAVMFIAAALEKAASTSGPAIAAALHSVTLSAANGDIFPGTLSFSSDGTPSQQPIFWGQDQGGKLEYVYPASLAQASVISYAS